MNVTDSIFDKLYDEKLGYTKYSFEIYKSIYNLETITHSESVTKTQLEYCKQKKYFILLILYNSKGQVFLKRNVQDNLYWEIMGRGIENNETVFEVVNSLAESVNPHILISDVEPVAFVENIFSHKKSSYTHIGLAFVARVRNTATIQELGIKGMFVDYSTDELEKINRSVNRKAVEYFFERYKEISDMDRVDFQDTEITTNEQYSGRYYIHNKFIKKFILTKKRRKKHILREKIYSHIGNSKKILDISCGDDDFIIKFDNDYKTTIDFVVGNDISWSQIESINQSRALDSKLIFTNHNAVFCPFVENAFDVVLCQNTLHHMPNRFYMQRLLRKMLDIGKKIIIVEVEDPTSTGGFPKFLHDKWYVAFLKDVGEAYLDENNFKTIINETYQDRCEIEYDMFQNIQGKYHIAIITKHSDSVIDDKVDKSIQQIQEKYTLNSDINDFMKIVKENEFTFIRKTNEQDTYFCDIKGDFISNRVCLRTRDTDDTFIEVLYKDDPYKDKKYVITEGVDFEIENKYKVNLVNFLEKLYYHKYCVVSKTREEYSFYKQDCLYKIFIDKFDSQFFVEFAVLTKGNQTREDLIEYLDDLLKLFRNLKFVRFTQTYRDYYARSLFDRIVPKGGLRALLVDLDGTLIPSERVFFGTWLYVSVKYYNCNFTLDEYIEYELKQDRMLIQFLKLTERLSSDINESDIMKRVYSQYKKSFKKMLNTNNSTPELMSLRELKMKGIKIALVTTSKKDYVDLFLDTYREYADVFDDCITRFDVENRKPDGEAYELAAKRLKVNSSECLVIEDTPKGVDAARDAKMKSVLVKRHTIIENHDADKDILIFDSFVEVTSILNRHIQEVHINE